MDEILKEFGKILLQAFLQAVALSNITICFSFEISSHSTKLFKGLFKEFS